jgi:hypothetical protein
MHRLTRLTRAAGIAIEPPTFARSRYQRRFNMQDEDRVKLFNWNLACIILTAVPFFYMHSVSYAFSEDTDAIMRTLDPMREAEITYDPSIFRRP